MPDWTASMTQTFEYYTVDPKTWKDLKLIDLVKSSTINRDAGVETLGSATIDVTDLLGECYIRIYLITIQNGIREKHALGTFLVQTPSSTYNGKKRNVSMGAYTPLMELKENPPPIGYFIAKDANIMDSVHQLTAEHMRAPVVDTHSEDTLYSDFVANTNDTWLSFISDLAAKAKYNLALDEMGRVLFEPDQDTASLQPVWTYDDSNSSILLPDFEMSHDLYGIPNVVEVIYSNGSDNFYIRVVNDDSNSPTSTVNRGREITYRDTEPSISGIPTYEQLYEYANQLLRTLSSVEYKITYTHGYCPVRVGDCVRLNYSRAQATDIKAKVISQSISCAAGCRVTETAVYTTKLWR